jgi:anti-sigma regulatory factor (Ser/Thr protein kinase)
MKEDIQLTLLSNPKLLASVRAMIRSYLEGLGFSQDRREEIVLAVDEAACNAIRHSYGGDATEPIAIALRSDEDWVEIKLEDQGLCADADAVAPKALVDAEKDTVTPGGLGVPLIYELCDEVKIEPTHPQGNRVHMRIRRPAQVNDTTEINSQRAEGQ